MLLDGGASKNVRDNYGRIPHDYVCLSSDAHCSDRTERELTSLLKPDVDFY